MSRFSDYCDYEGEPEQILANGRWEWNARRALKGKRGRRALAELREALMALPEHRLIDRAMCTVGAEQRRGTLLAEAEREKAVLDEHLAVRYGPSVLDTTAADALAEHVEREGEGVCINGAYAWYQKVKAGMDAQEAFASLPLVADYEDAGYDTLDETAHLGEQAGLTFTLAWELAYRNDETYRAMTPEERWEHFVQWIDKELAEVPS